MSSHSPALPASQHNSQEGQPKKGTDKFKRSPFLEDIFLFLIEHVAYFLRFVPERLYPELFYPIEEQFVSTTTRVIFTRRKQNRQPVCLKLWRFENVRIPQSGTKNVDDMLEGFGFNQRFAPNVYLGIAPVLEMNEETKKIKRGKLIEKPCKGQMKPEAAYVFVMRCLDKTTRLDYQVCQERLATLKGVEFLAKEVAQMHRRLAISPRDRGHPSSILLKLQLNRQRFGNCLSHLNQNSEPIDQYIWISDLMVRAFERHIKLFQERYDDHYIKRCHGDLKTTNLWIEPEKVRFFGLKKHPQRLIAIDCIDFNPEFCHIDTLSDIAMLIIDLERYLADCQQTSSNGQAGETLTQHFLECYFREMREDSEKWYPLLEYYMTEKSMVRAYVSILYDNLLEEGKKYLDIALVHAQRLQEMLDSAEIGNSSPLIQTNVVVG